MPPRSHIPPIQCTIHVLATPSASNDSDNSEPNVDENSVNSNNADFDTDYTFQDDAPEFDYAASGFKFHERILHFLRSNLITSMTRQIVEICMIIEACTIVSDDETTNALKRDEMMKDGDIILLNGFDLNYLSPPTLRSEMAVKIYNAKSALNGDRL